MKHVHDLQEEQSDEETTFLSGANDEPADMFKPMIKVELNGVSIQFKVDTGANVTIIPSNNHAKLDGVQMLQMNKLLSGPQKDHLKVVGKLITNLMHSGKQTAKVFVIRFADTTSIGLACN